MRFICSFKHIVGDEIKQEVKMLNSKADIYEFAIKEVAFKIVEDYNISHEIIERRYDDDGEEIKKPGILYIRRRKSYAPSKLCGL
jgi:hypothetical protein